MFGLTLSLSVVKFGLNESAAIAQTELGFPMKMQVNKAQLVVFEFTTVKGEGAGISADEFKSFLCSKLFRGT